MTSKDDIPELGMEAALTEGGVSLRVRSRLATALDFFGARWLTQKTPPENAALEIQDAITRAQVAIIDAASQRVASEISENFEQASRVLAYFSKRSADDLRTIDTVLGLTCRDILSDPSAKRDEPDSGGDISEEFLRRWERHASVATTEEAHARWAKVLAQEIKRPGSFSPKALRIIDETEPELARLFSEMCSTRVVSYIPMILHTRLSVLDFVNLEAAGLIMDAGTGLAAFFQSHADTSGTFWWMLMGTRYAIGVPHDIDTRGSAELMRAEGELVLMVKTLTPVGKEISTLFPYDEKESLRALARAIATNFSVPVRLFHQAEGEGAGGVRSVEEIRDITDLSTNSPH